MISCRSFLNTDPPLLVKVWNRQPRQRGIAQGVTTKIMEDLVFSRPWFDPAGLVLGFRDQRLAGFVHAGFSAKADGSDLNLKHGVISQLRIVPEEGQNEVAAALIESAIAYLAKKNVVECSAASQFPWAPFYLGIYGGSRVPGVMSDDVSMMNPLLTAGFEALAEVGVFLKPLNDYRPRIDRQLMNLKRQFDFTVELDPPAFHWWEACTLGESYRVRYSLVDRSNHESVASVTYWDMQPLAGSWGARAMGMYDLRVADRFRRTGMATCVINESLKQLAQDGIGMVEAQTPLADERACGCFTKLGFGQVDTAIQLRKSIP